MKLLIVAGGGGHFAPALAVIEELPKDWEVMVVGRKYVFEGENTLSLEYQTSKNLGIRFQTITTGRLQRKLTTHTLTSLIKVPIGYFQALNIIKDFKPDVVLSFGGYVSVPVGLAAKSLNIPIVVHEQILGAGLANKIVGKLAGKICVSWEQSKKFFPNEKVVVTGNPIRHVILNEVKNLELEKILRFSAQDDRKIIYVTGGSGGAHAINALVEECLEKLLEKYIVIHQTGDAKEYGDFARLEKKKETLSPELQKLYSVFKFVESSEVFSILNKADLVISRSGINTVTELLKLGKPSLLIPLPYGQHNEQLTNALFIKKIGLCEVAEQESLTGDKLFALVEKMISNIEDYKSHAKDGQDLLIEDAAQKIIKVVENVNQSKKTA